MTPPSPGTAFVLRARARRCSLSVRSRPRRPAEIAQAKSCLGGCWERAGQARSFLTAPGRGRQSLPVPGGQPKPTLVGRRWSRQSRLGDPHSGSAIPRVKPVRGNSPSAVAARDLGSRPPIAAEVGRDRLTSVGREPTPRTASGGQNASGGGHLIGVPLRRTARPLVDHYPRTKSEDDAVGAPRLVLRRWDTTVVPRRVPPAPMRSKCPKGRGRVPRPTSQLEVLVGRAGDESVRQ